MNEILIKDTDGPATIDKGSMDNNIKKILLSLIDINYNLSTIFYILWCYTTIINKMKSKIILFMPCVDLGGVEKNFFLISNFLAKNKNNVIVISISKNIKKHLDKNIKLISLNLNIWDKLSRRLKFLLGLFLLIKEISKNKDSLVVSFQANIYCGLLSKIFGFNLIIRSNSSPEGWSKNFVKTFIYKVGLNAAKEVIVNSKEFKNIIKKKFNVNTVKIYNPLNKEEIIRLSKKKIKFIFFEKNHLNIINIGRL